MEADGLRPRVVQSEELKQVIAEKACMSDAAPLERALVQGPGIVVVLSEREAFDLVIIDGDRHRSEGLGDIQILEYRLFQPGFEVVNRCGTARIGQVAPRSGSCGGCGHSFLR